MKFDEIVVRATGLHELDVVVFGRRAARDEVHQPVEPRGPERLVDGVLHGLGGDLRGILQLRRHLLIHRLQEAQRLLELLADHRNVRGVDLLRQGGLERPHQAVPAVDRLIHDAVQADAVRRRGEVGHVHRRR